MKLYKQMTKNEWGENNCDTEMLSLYENSQLRSQVFPAFKNGTYFLYLPASKEIKQFTICINKNWYLQMIITLIHPCKDICNQDFLYIGRWSPAAAVLEMSRCLRPEFTFLELECCCFGLEIVLI